MTALLLAAALGAEVRLAATLLDGGPRVRVEVAGPPGAAFLVLGSAYGGGSQPPGWPRLVVAVHHPFHNVLRSGALDAAGQAAFEGRVPAGLEVYYLQAVALEAGPTHAPLGVSAALRWTPGPPGRFEAVPETLEREPWKLLVLLAPALLAPLVRRRPALLGALPLAAGIALALHPGAWRAPLRALAAHRLDRDRALDAFLGAANHRALRAADAALPRDAMLWMPFTNPLASVLPRYASYLLYPREVENSEEKVRAALLSHREVYALLRDEETPPPDLRAAAVPGWRSSGYRLLRLAP
jgi:hypothetical protein